MRLRTNVVALMSQIFEDSRIPQYTYFVFISFRFFCRPAFVDTLCDQVSSATNAIFFFFWVDVRIGLLQKNQDNFVRSPTKKIVTFFVTTYLGRARPSKVTSSLGKSRNEKR